MLPKVVKDTYSTYRGDKAWHRSRIASSIIISIIIGLTGLDLEKNTFPVTSLVITVLTGFVFTALFSSYSVPTDGLQAPNSENDRHDLVTLRKLGHNFSVRSRFFIILALTNLFVIVLLTTNLSAPMLIKYPLSGISNDVRNASAYFVECAGMWAATLGRALAVFLFFEVLYTFYRLAETILSVLDVRKSYSNGNLE